MGTGASSSITAATEKELQTLFSTLPTTEKEKLQAALYDLGQTRPELKPIVPKRVDQCTADDVAVKQLEGPEQSAAQQVAVVAALEEADPKAPVGKTAVKCPTSAEQPQSNAEKVAAAKAAAEKAAAEKAAAASVTLKIHGFAGLLCEVDADRSWDLARVMGMIEKFSSVPAQEQLLYVGTDPFYSDMLRTKFATHSVVDLTLVRREIKARVPSTVSSCLEDDSYSCFGD